MIGLGLSITQRAVLQMLAFSPASLFAASEPGVWYDPSDFSTMFQDAAGTTPVTAVEQPVGLILDKSKGLVLGPELVTNGDFATGTTSGWTEVISGGVLNASTGQLVVNNASGTGNTGVYQVRNCTANQFLRVSIQVIARTEARLAVFNGTLGTTVYSNNSLPVGTSTFIVGPMPSGTFTVYAHCSAGNTATFDNISVRELPGNHATQTTATSRPVLSARKNFYVNTETLATQNVTTRAAKYIVSFWGTGSITLSGTATGTLTGTGADDRVYLEFTATAGTLTSTVSGSVLKAQLEEV